MADDPRPLSEEQGRRPAQSASSKRGWNDPGVIVQNTPRTVMTVARGRRRRDRRARSRRSGAEVRVDGSENAVLWEKLARQAPVAAATALASGRSASCAAIRSGAAASKTPSPRRARVARADGVELTPKAQWEIIDAMPAGPDLVDRPRHRRRPPVRARRDHRRRRAGGASARRARAGARRACLRKRRMHAERYRADSRARPARSASRTRTSGRSRGIRCSRTRSRPRVSPASSTASSARRTAARSPRSRSATAPTSHSCAHQSSRRRRPPTSSGSRTRSTSSASTTTCSRSSAPPTHSAGRRCCSAGCSNCSQRPRPTRSGRSSS